MNHAISRVPEKARVQVSYTRDQAQFERFSYILSNITATVPAGTLFTKRNETGAPNENIVQNHLNIALVNVF